MEVAVSATEVNPNFIFNNVPYDLWQPSLSPPPPPPIVIHLHSSLSLSSSILKSMVILSILLDLGSVVNLGIYHIVASFSHFAYNMKA